MNPTERGQLKLEPDLLWDTGFKSLTRAQVSDILAEIYDTLELRVGHRIAEKLDVNQLATFERIVAGHDEADALAWLRKTVPTYQDTVRSEYSHIVNTLRNAAELRKSSRSEEAIVDDASDRD